MPVTLVTSLFSMNCKVKPSGVVGVNVSRKRRRYAMAVLLNSKSNKLRKNCKEPI